MITLTAQSPDRINLLTTSFGRWRLPRTTLEEVCGGNDELRRRWKQPIEAPEDFETIYNRFEPAG
jgi:hypothetical protein